MFNVFLILSFFIVFLSAFRYLQFSKETGNVNCTKKEDALSDILLEAEGSVFVDLSYDVDDSVVAVHDDGHDLILEFDGIGFADDVLGALCQRFDGDHGNAGSDQLFGHFRSVRVHRYALVRDDHVHDAARGHDGVDLGNDAGNAASRKRADDDGQRRTLCGVGMTADGAADDPVRTGQHVDVEVRVDFQRGQDDEVQLVDSCLASIARVGRRIDLLMEMVVL